MILQLVAGSREREDEEEVDHVGHGRLSLADADRLHEDDVEPGGLAEEHRLARAAGDASGRRAAGRRPDERGRLERQATHPRLVPEDRSTREGARRIDGQDGDAMPPPEEEHPDRVHERALSHAGHPGDTDPARATRRGQQAPEELLRERSVRTPARLSISVIACVREDGGTIPTAHAAAS